MSESNPFAGRTSGTTLWPISSSQTAALAMAIVGATAWIASSRRSMVLLALAIVVAACAAGPRGASVADRAVRVAKFFARSRWTYVSQERASNGATRLSARGSRTTRSYLLEQRGRLDLTGADRRYDTESATLLERIASLESSQFVTWHLACGINRAVITLALPESVRAPSRWRDGASTVSDSTGRRVGHERSGWLYERWTHVRDGDGVLACFALISSLAGAHEPVLRDLVGFGSQLEATVVAKVETSRRAAAVAGRAAHRWRANMALVSLGGFRERATMDAASRALVERESAVAHGRALVETAVIVVLRAESRAELARRTQLLSADARRAGARLTRGNGTHALWLCASLPGSPAWDRL